MKRNRPILISSEGASSLAKRLHSFISPAGATSLKNSSFVSQKTKSEPSAAGPILGGGATERASDDGFEKTSSRTIRSPRRRWSGQRDSPGFAAARRHALVGRKLPPAVFYRFAMPPFRIPALTKKHGPPKGDPCFWSGQRDSNSLPPPWQGGALPNELCPQCNCRRYYTKISVFVKQKN